MNNSALLVIDVQNCMFDPEPVCKSEELLANLQALLHRARAAKTPIIFVQHNGPEGAPHAPGEPGWELHSALDRQPNELVIQKTMPDSFYETDLQEKLTELGIQKLVLAGIQTEYCVDTTCRRASSEGYEVTLVQDAHGTWNNEHITAEQIIAHHNHVLGDWFATLKATAKVEFA